MVRNEIEFFRIWIRYYRNFFRDDDIYIIEHGCSPAITPDVRNRHHVITVPFHGFPVADFRERHIMFLHRQLEETGKYNYIIVNDVDEVLITDPEIYPTLIEYLDQLDGSPIAPDTYSVLFARGDKKIDLGKKVLTQRSIWAKEFLFEKTIINSRTPFWTIGFHYIYDISGYVSVKPEEIMISRFNFPLHQKHIDKNVILLHLKRMDYSSLLRRHVEQKKFEKTADFQWRYKFLCDKAFDDWFYQYNDMSEKIPKKFRNIV